MSDKYFLLKKMKRPNVFDDNADRRLRVSRGVYSKKRAAKSYMSDNRRINPHRRNMSSDYRSSQNHGPRNAKTHSGAGLLPTSL